MALYFAYIHAPEAPTFSCAIKIPDLLSKFKEMVQSLTFPLRYCLMCCRLICCLNYVLYLFAVNGVNALFVRSVHHEFSLLLEILFYFFLFFFLKLKPINSYMTQSVKTIS